MKHEDPHWRRAKLAALILERAARGTLSARDRRLAALFAADEGVTNRLIHQAQIARSARHHVSTR
jgi:hypothetical protein